MKRLALAAAVLAVSGSLYSAGASAQFAKPDDAIKLSLIATLAPLRDRMIGASQ